MKISELREWYEAESNHSHCCYSTEVGSYSDRYVEWVERRLIGYRERMCKDENCKYQNNEAGGVVFCANAGGLNE